MGRPKSPEEQQLRAHVLHEQGFTPKAIKQELEQEFEKPVSLRTVERWRSDFKSKRFQVKVPKGTALKDRGPYLDDGPEIRSYGLHQGGCQRGN